MKITLTRATERDIAFIMEYERRPGYEALVGRWSEEQHKATLKDDNWLTLVGADETGTHRGFVLLRDFTAGSDSLYLKRIAVRDAERGFGKALLSAVTDWVFANTGFHRFWLEVIENNSRARHVYASLGWHEEGLVREAFQRPDGSRGSYIQMSILKYEHLSLSPQGERARVRGSQRATSVQISNSTKSPSPRAISSARSRSTKRSASP
jgi:RimJ/RimL family protein N-acetyltransferase